MVNIVASLYIYISIYTQILYIYTQSISLLVGGGLSYTRVKLSL